MGAPFGNKFALGCTTNGQPPMYKTPEEMQEKIIGYFESLVEKKNIGDGEFEIMRKPTVTGLTLFLGFASKQSIRDYMKKENFKYILGRAKMVIENSYEMQLESKNVAGAIFALKNMGWADKIDISQEVDDKRADLSTLSDDELVAYNAIQSKLKKR